MRIKLHVMAVLVLVIIFGGIASAMALDLWSTKFDRTYFADETGLSGESGESEGGELIKGSTTFQQLLDMGITAEQIEQVLGAELPPAEQRVKDYCEEHGLSFDDIKAQLTLNE